MAKNSRLNKRLIVFVLVISAWCCVSASAASRGLHVVVTTSIIEDLVQNVAGQNATLTVLAGAHSDPHTYEPKPEDNVKIAQADIIFENGLYLEPWMDKLYKTSQSQAQRVVVSAGVPLIKSPNYRHEKAMASEYDPHVWHDVSNVRLMVKTIRDIFVKVDPPRAQEYQRNAELYDQALMELDQWIATQVAHIPQERKKLVTSHDTFEYFARRYGFTIIGTVIGSATTEASDPSALEMTRLIKEIRLSGIKTIFLENAANPQLVKTLAREAGIQVAPELYADALGASGTYIQMMRTNVRTIVEALQP